MQADHAVVDAFLSNASTYRANSSVLFLDVDLHDVQCLAMLRRGVGCRHRLFSIRVEKVSNRRRNRTLPLAFSKLLQPGISCRLQFEVATCTIIYDRM